MSAYIESSSMSIYSLFFPCPFPVYTLSALGHETRGFDSTHTHTFLFVLFVSCL